MDRVPCSLRPDGATQRRREGRCSHGDDLERTASGRRWTACRGTTTRPDEATQRQPVARSVEGRAELGTVFTGPAEARATNGPGQSHGVDEADRGGGRVINPNACEVGDAARWRWDGGRVRDEAGDGGRQGGYDWPPHGARPPDRVMQESRSEQDGDGRRRSTGGPEREQRR